MRKSAARVISAVVAAVVGTTLAIAGITAAQADDKGTTTPAPASTSTTQTTQDYPWIP